MNLHNNSCYTFRRKQIFETERLIFRKFEKTDFEDLHKILRDPEVMKYISDIKTKEGTIEWISISQKSYQENGYGPWATILKDSGKLIGYCGIYLQENIDGKDEVEVLYAFHKKHWNKGYATEAAKAAFKYSRNTYNIYRFIALVEYGNTRSARVAKKVGMKLEKDIKKSGRSYSLYAIN